MLKGVFLAHPCRQNLLPGVAGHRGQLGEGHEPADALEVDHHAAAVLLHHPGGYRGVVLLVFQQLQPTAFLHRLVNGEESHVAGAAPTLDGNHHAVARLQPFLIFLGQGAHFLGRDNALGFQADADHDAVIIHPHHFALNHLAPLIAAGR